VPLQQFKLIHSFIHSFIHSSNARTVDNFALSFNYRLLHGSFTVKGCLVSTLGPKIAYVSSVTGLLPRAGSGVVRIDPLRFLAGCRKRRLNQALSILSIAYGFF